MSPTAIVTYTTPDGVERTLRFTLGARKRIAERFQEPDLMMILNRYGDGALPDVAYSMMYDAHGDPPKDLDLKQFAEALDDGTPLMAAIMAAIGKGAASKNELEALLRKMQEEKVRSLIGSVSGALPDSASDLPAKSSGTPLSANLTLLSNTGATENAPPTIELD